MPLVYALYRVVSDPAAGHAVGALDSGLVASATAASVLGLHLTIRIADEMQQNLLAALVLVSLALVAAALTFATQRWFSLPMMDLSEQPSGVASIQTALPWLTSAGVLAAACFVPAGLLVYWVATNAWTFAQQGLI